MDEVVTSNGMKPGVMIGLQAGKVVFALLTGVIAAKLANDHFDASITKMVVTKLDIPNVEG